MDFIDILTIAQFSVVLIALVTLTCVEIYLGVTRRKEHLKYMEYIEYKMNLEQEFNKSLKEEEIEITQEEWERLMGK